MPSDGTLAACGTSGSASVSQLWQRPPAQPLVCDAKEPLEPMKMSM